MNQPMVTRPLFPEGYVDNPQAILSWDHVEERLTDSINYWLCSVKPDGRPHAVPKWGVFVNGRFYFDGSPETRHARNIAQNPHVNLHLEDGSDVVIVEGQAKELHNLSLEQREVLAQAYTAKYAALGYSPEPHYWENGGLFEIKIQTAIAWTTFNVDPTKFVFVPE